MLSSMKWTTAGVAGLVLLVISVYNPSVSAFDSTKTWHTGPINCYNCNGLEACTASSGTLRKCEGNIDQSCVAIFDASGATIQRGCSDVLQESCNDDNCYQCRSHGCNDLKNNQLLIECVHCDGESTDDCVFNIEMVTSTRMCNGLCMTALYPRTQDENAPLELARSCLDDLSLDDREACAEGTLDNCAACSTAKCNTVEIGTRSSCNHCTGGNCDNPKPQTCRAVAANGHDQCFIQVDETDQIWEMGCHSQFNLTDVNLLLSNKRLWLCTGDDCNVATALPKEHTCKLCNSRTDSNCVLEPEQVIGETTCAQVVNTDCYTRLLDDGHTERGCLTSLEADDYIECLSGSNSTKCFSCSGDNCNTQPHPDTRLSCYVCSSTSDANCEAAPDVMAVCLLHSASQQCVTMLDENGSTLRGCSESLNCTNSDAQHCNLCSNNNCNSINLARRADGQPGQWQQHLPLACDICQGLEQCAEKADAAVCLSELEYCMTVFDDSGAVVARGCSNEVEAAHGAFCDSSPSSCRNCNSNSCNNAITLSQYVECIYCDSLRNSDCTSKPEAVTSRRQCNGQCMTALRPRSSAVNAIYDTVRSCLDDKNVTQQQSCAAGSDAECAACSADACNKVKLPATRLSCYHCNGDECISDLISHECRYYTPEDQCYMQFDYSSSVVSMGCQSDLSSSFVDENLHLLLFCNSGNNCNGYENIPESTSCVTCSSKDDANCAVDPTKITQVEECSELPHTGCMTRVHTDNSTRRGCISSLSSSQIKACLRGENYCTTCTGSLCNKEIYPADRRRCHRCSSLTDANCEKSPSAGGSVCPHYSESQGCSAKVVDGNTYRGCGTEFICDDTDKQHCRVCSSGDNCNIVDLISTQIGYPGKWSTPPLNCYSCEGVTCQGDKLGTLRKCEGSYNQNCATVFADDGTVVMRGCSDTLYANVEHQQYCDATHSACKFCKSSGCNNAHKLDTYVDCLFCNGVEQHECVRAVDDINRRVSCQAKCFTGLYKRSINASTTFELSRGCLDDLEYDDQLACEQGELANCKACSVANCNVDNVPEQRLSCNFCNDDDCTSFSPQSCISYSESDQCYVHVGDKRILGMGCASDFDNDFLLANRRDLLLCSSDNCNTKDDLNLVGISCTKCKTNETEGCLEGTYMEETTCNHYLWPQCILHTTVDGVLSRGCLMDADDAVFDECLSGTSSSCKVCDSNQCNQKEIYPADWRSCIRCDAQVDANCASDASSLGSYCPRYVAGDACVTRLEKLNTRRGCQSEFSCDPLQTDNCRICDSSNNCNIVDLTANHVGPPGKWQDLPLSCYVCEDAAACATGLGVSQVCENNNMQVCSTVFGTDGQVLARGCSDAVSAAHANYCDEHADSCFRCKSNECNNAITVTDYVDCYYCDADENASCARDTPTSGTMRTRKCQGHCMQALYQRSSAADSPLLLTRSCLDDMDKMERESCAAGSHANCTACTTALCNIEQLVDSPNYCHHCKDVECMEFEPKQCVSYRPDDQCYLAFNDEGVIEMGCASDFETLVVLELVAQKKLLLCSGKNCNDMSIIPDPNNCMQCDSASNARCATNPSMIIDYDICSEQPYTQCVTRIDAQGGTRRGCLSSLSSDDFVRCLNGEDELCQMCDSDKCNGYTVFPEERRKCHQCDSKTTPLCASSPNSGNVCPIYVANDACVSTLHDGITYRGCNSTLSCADGSDCRICATDNCNTINLEQLNMDGLPGVWQNVPIKCLSCDSASACADGDGTAQLCEHDSNCITVFNAEGSVTQRGCTNELFQQVETETYCINNMGNCPRCNSNECNVANGLDEYVDCLVCDSSQNAACVQDVESIAKSRRCHKQCMSALRPLFNEHNDSYAMVRNCYDDMESADREACAANTKDNCQTCTGAKCNTVELIEERLSCYICTGDDCQVQQAASCPNYRENDQCYIEFDEKRSVVGYGCLSQYSHADIYLLHLSKRLWICDGPNCNSLESLPIKQSCALCSSRTDGNCATNPSSVTSQTDCQLNGLPECYSRVLSDGATERGCLSSLEQDEFLACYNGSSTSCSSCIGELCNKEVYPPNRALCHICSSNSNDKCTTSPNSEAVCPIYAEDDVCVTSYRNGVTYRGCGSSISCEENSRNCVKCKGNGCNVVDLSVYDDDDHGKWQDLPLSCLSCSSEEACATTSTSIVCQGNNEQDCVTVFSATGVVVSRGCQDDIELQSGAYCVTNSGNCPICKSNNCNNATALSQYQSCIYCDSFKSSSCLWEPTSSSHRNRLCQGSCMTALYGSSESGLDVMRSCLDDKEVADQLRCLAGKDGNCVACTDSANCNVAIVPSDRLSCYTCDGADCDEPTSKVCAIYKPNDSCFLWVDEDNSIKQLGCLSSFRNQDLESVIKTKRVSVCQGANCNLPKMPDPVKCAVCDSKDDELCATNAMAISNFQTCNQMPHTNCVTRYNEDETIMRGCLYDLPQTEFAACLLGNDENCAVCDKDGCNREIFPAHRPVCYSCSSEDDSDCESDPKYTLACARVEDETCRTSLAGNVTTRGCSSNVACDPSDYRNCRTCQEHECNSIDLFNRVDDGQHGMFQQLPLQCHACIGEHCKSSLGPSHQCKLNVDQDCKTVFEADGETVRRRGCSDDVDDYEDRYCRQHPELCFICKSNDCNQAWSISDYTSCISCTTLTDSKCLADPISASNTRRCEGQCMVSVVNGQLVRSCLNDKEEFDRSACSSTAEGAVCARCEGAQCNAFMYPANRLSCHVCTSDNCDSSLVEYCQLYDPNDQCIAKYKSGKVELLGCASDQNATELEQWRHDQLVYECNVNECNDLTRLPNIDVCLSCDSSKTLACAQNPSLVTVNETCEAPSSVCVTRISEEGHTLRGCLSGQDSCGAAGSCATCKGEKCNADIYPANRRQCHICQSTVDTACISEPNHLQICPIYKADDQCVYKKENGLVQRGCSSELSCDASDTNNCYYCNKDGCNNSASRMLKTIGLAMTLLVALLVGKLH